MTTITGEATAAELLTELRELVNRYDGAATLDDVRQLADEVSARLRRARGRISRIVKSETPPVPPAPVVEPKPAAEDSIRQPDGKPAPAVDEKPPESRVNESDSPETHAPVRPRPARRRVASFAVTLAVLTVVSSLWSTSTTRTRRAVRVVRTGARRAARLAATVH
jgi:hypothetical protein